MSVTVSLESMKELAAQLPPQEQVSRKSFWIL